MDHLPKTKASIEQRTMIVVLVYVVVVVVALTFLGVKGLLKKSLIDETGLNMLGDFTAGFFAPLAFIGLAGAFYLQHQQLSLAKAQNDANELRQAKQAIAEENAARLNFAATQANYKVALYDKRKIVYDQLVKLHAFNQNIDNKLHEHLKKAVFDARFMFPEEIYDWLKQLMEDASRGAFLDTTTKEYERRMKGIGAISSIQESDEMAEKYEELSALQASIFERLLSESIFQRFEPSMRLPNYIDYERAKSIDEKINVE